MGATWKDVSLNLLSQDGNALFELLNRQEELPGVLVAASFISEQLATLLATRMIEGSSNVGKMLGANGELGDISVRAKLAYCLGLISKREFEDIGLVAKVRNRFAHSHLQLTFEDHEVQEHCSNLKTWKEELFASVFKAWEATQSEIARTNAWNQFKLAATMLVVKLEIKITANKQNKHPVSPADPPVAYKRIENL